jgi:hypothetical protein
MRNLTLAVLAASALLFAGFGAQAQSPQPASQKPQQAQPGNMGQLGNAEVQKPRKSAKHAQARHHKRIAHVKAKHQRVAHVRTKHHRVAHKSSQTQGMSTKSARLHKQQQQAKSRKPVRETTGSGSMSKGQQPNNMAPAPQSQPSAPTQNEKMTPPANQQK